MKATTTTDPLDAALEHVSHLLPDQGPIDVFIHHNTLHSLQHLDFHEAVESGARRYGARPYMTDAAFRDAVRQGRILEHDLSAVLAEHGAAKRWSGGSWLGGAIDARGVRLLSLLHDLEPERDALFAYRLVEERRAERLGDDVPEWARGAVIEGGRAHAAEASERLDVAQRAALLALVERDPEAVATRTLWERCVRLAREADLLRSPVGDGEESRFAERRRRAHAVIAPVLIRSAAAFLDSGVSSWSMPERELGYYVAARRFLCALPVAVDRWLDDARATMRVQEASGVDARTALRAALDRLAVRDEHVGDFLEREALVLRGWAGMMSRLERHPHERSDVRASLTDYLAVRLTLLACAIDATAGEESSPPAVSSPFATASAQRLFRVFCLSGIGTDRASRMTPSEAGQLLDVLEGFDAFARGGVYQEAFERRYRIWTLDALAPRGRVRSAAPAAPRLQFVFCIDEREESLRRAIESLDSGYETWGVAGFFGLPMEHHAIDAAHPVSLCPVVVRPAHAVLERPRREHAGRHRRWARARRAYAIAGHALSRASRSLASGAVASLVGGVALGSMLVRVLFPRVVSRLHGSVSALVAPPPATELVAARPDGASELVRGKPVGFTTDEQVERVGNVLVTMGMTKGFGSVVVVLGHGHTSLNNPHRSSYDCGACGGRRGGASARLFASLANREDVRAGLRARGIDVPNGTWFVGGMHDTCSDAVVLYDADLVPPSNAEALREARATLDRARALSADERCRRFELAPSGGDPVSSLRHVEWRATSIAEPRPEYGHGSNAVAIVGRRSLTRGLFLDRRAFLASYDPSADADGEVLAGVLGAVVPVCAGINLEYYFSFVDNEVYGCGTKLPHNVTSLLGIMNGSEGDLRPGLPWQTVEVHEPMRLLTVVEAPPDRVSRVFEASPVLREILAGRWIQLAAIDPESGQTFVLGAHGFERYRPESLELPTVGSSREWYEGRLGHLRPARIEGREVRRAG